MTDYRTLKRVSRSIENLYNPKKREVALWDLRTLRHSVQDFGLILWHSFGTVAILIEEMTRIYPFLASSKTLSIQQCYRACNALSLLKSAASHPSVRPKFLAALFPEYIYPFLCTSNKACSFEYIRLASLDVIAALAASEEHEVIDYFLNFQMIPALLKNMQNKNERGKLVATYILRKILMDDNGLEFVCETFERFSKITVALEEMRFDLCRFPSTSLLKHIIACYLRLCDNQKALSALRICLPINRLTNRTFEIMLDETAKESLYCLVRRIQDSGNQSGIMQDSGNQSGIMQDSGNQSGIMQDSGNQSGRMQDQGNEQIEKT